VPGNAVGNGFLQLADFQRLLDENTRIQQIELSNYGEILLNPDLIPILRLAHERKVALTAENGVNLNRATDDILEALVTYQLRSMTCSIDGASQETYARYRVRGDYDRVLANVRRLVELKRTHNSEYPHLTWQFIVFGHNEHEIPAARSLAHTLGMTFSPKLSWDPDFSPVRDRDAVRRAVGAADRAEFEAQHGTYLPYLCHELWDSPQVNWDGRILGCSRNFWGDFGANAFDAPGLRAAVNSPDMRYAREMLQGRQPPKDGIPCTTCSVYEEMVETGRFLRRSPRQRWNPSPRVKASAPYRAARSLYHAVRDDDGALRRRERLTSRVRPLAVPLPLDVGADWTSSGVFRGRVRGVRSWACHVSVLAPGASPHPPHRHAEEEILLVLDGEVEVVVPDVAAAGGLERVRLTPGQFAYYPRDFAHTLQAVGDDPATYLMFKWAARPEVGEVVRRSPAVAGRGGPSGVPGSRQPPPLEHGVFSPLAGDVEARESAGFATYVALHHPTEHLRTLHVHASELAPGAGYAAHADPYDVAIVLLEGEVETLGRRVLPHGVILYAAGEPHGMHNPGSTPARYLVFEFHRRENILRRGLRATVGRGRRGGSGAASVFLLGT